jgi:hypothetical protein
MRIARQPHQFSTVHDWRHKLGSSPLWEDLWDDLPRWTEDLSSALVTADEAGEVTVWAAESAGSYKVSPTSGVETGASMDPPVWPALADRLSLHVVLPPSTKA